MSRIKFFIDGFNVYHALEREASYHKYKWLDYSKLVSLFVQRQDQIVEVLYFTALANWDIQKVKTLFPAKKVGVVIPINWRAVLLKQVCDFHMKMKEKHLKASLFPNEIDLGGGIKLSCPLTWR